MTTSMDTKRAEEEQFKKYIEKTFQLVCANRNDLKPGYIGTCFKSAHVTLEINKLTAIDVDFAERFFKKHNKYLKSVTLKLTKTKNQQQSESKKMMN